MGEEKKRSNGEASSEAARRYYSVKNFIAKGCIGQERLEGLVLSCGKKGAKTPDLESFIVNVIPPKVKLEALSNNHDVDMERFYDIQFLDKSENDIRLATTLSHHADLLL
jgi:hypothetical protein